MSFLPTAAPEALLVAGTRPEAIKLAPLALAMAAAGRIRPIVLAAGQHPTMVHEALAAFGLRPDAELRLDRRTGALAELAAAVVAGIDRLLAERGPAVVVVQGDTTTAAMAAQAAFWRQIPVVHLEAGLRSHDLYSPFPEEANRKIIGQVAALHLAPTTEAQANLAAEGIAGPNLLTIGNTVVDAVRTIAGLSRECSDARLEAAIERARSGGTRLVLVTAHRRESWGAPLNEVLRAVADLVAAHPDIEVVLPVHPNPLVGDQVRTVLGGLPRVTLTEALPYQDLVRALSAATLVISDSGGIQEEAPSFGAPVLVLREVTERMEAVRAGCALLVGTDRAKLTGAANRLLRDEQARRAMTAAGNPFGDGSSADRAEQAIAWLLRLAAEPPAEFGAAPRAGLPTAA
ncbi:UDP-N-acetylglucosamine 2-epimerase (non-hydrolyzing) [Amycolatopsis sp. K13G38]|uniref:UDP-N-acetylglucosamine 2-epimerase (non-hydrolyzing) n=1 Tax=Amycolatopsis acididurans TaxID=2724524 RepID=A0ABX1J2G4_9PSEU|nr:UDP-N-acetylglucosamine 2-epimerase (non-hydrolyzing) [Amycolatopsis acididurans]NKQ52535.1 UDP-N-acetylglucosamine 2-epimerase (non-hydrolyzing) [Amycolatopsis acididurans]